jgi:putative ABC transport system permease protein
MSCPDTGAIPLDPGQLVFAGGFLIANIVVIHLLELGLERDITLGGFRATVQLLMVGYFLRWVFLTRQVAVVMLAFGIMLSVAVWTATRRVKRKLPGLLYKSALSIVLGSGITTVIVTAFVIGTDPWWDPRYFLPLAGMIVGNAMNAAALVSERMVSEIISRQGEIEALLSLAATPRQAVAPALRAALRSSMIPSINGMMTVGLVSLPGMMTGQMLGGADPSVAARYQLMIVFVLAGATSAVAVSLSMLLYHSFFTSAWQLRKELVASE